MAQTPADTLHQDSIVIDGLVISKWSRDVFEQMHRGGLTAVNCTCSVWEGFNDTMANIALWKKDLAENADILTPVHSAADIRRAKAENKVGIVLGWQNTYAIEQNLDHLRLFRDLGVRVIQLTYNTQNLVGSGCWESRDSGLSDYGRDMVDLMNELGILVDLSHVGDTTSRDAIAHSEKPVAYTHCFPNALLDHPRNKSDEMLQTLADKGGFVGVVAYTPFMPKGDGSTVEDVLDGFEHMIDLVGEDQVGIGTDFTQGQDVAFFDYLRSDKGIGRQLSKPMAKRPDNPIGFDGPAEYPNLTAAMMKRGWGETRIGKILGENWLAFLEEVWGG
ncbi:MAG: membrane dipeptidase [Rhodospirillaceae bacterium]|jgi:membrane dipeptidase|nr:membrane dipeptidase [Rhodospirillaceae bacterium]MBT3780245.1 membrane dipeptidase [Rhodospirillaceae bacterium]MBT3978858.1 membrane dipeptidase [Rhodospirillaceae bacterium]MBT4168099.1 membrane dipeptidase [Rhodospirillaceae bacterium]MBT4565896.1 membrane dipeptidase [Rhodospirillaceae bacterium]